MAKSHLKLVTPATANRTVTPKRVPNADLRTREYLTEAEVERLLTAANGNRWGHRDATMILVAYRHGLRVSELVDLRWDQVEFATATLHVRRVKQGTFKHPPDPRRRTAGAATASARAGTQVALRVHLGTRGTV
jgi:type 1 fimbriae regulatory protein FimB/type 1 fimbriae regulatory protein FimE